MSQPIGATRAATLLSSSPLGARAADAQAQNRLAAIRREKRMDDLRRELGPKLISFKTSWANGQGPPTRSN